MKCLESSIIQRINSLVLQKGWDWAQITDETGIEPDWLVKLVSWEAYHGWDLSNRLPNATGFQPGRQKKLLSLDTFRLGECDGNMLEAFKAGLIDEIWAGFHYDHGGWWCHVWGFKDSVLCDRSGANEYIGVQVV